jgi:hypothetical protein
MGEKPLFLRKRYDYGVQSGIRLEPKAWKAIYSQTRTAR